MLMLFQGPPFPNMETYSQGTGSHLCFRHTMCLCRPADEVQARTYWLLRQLGIVMDRRIFFFYNQLNIYNDCSG